MDHAPNPALSPTLMENEFKDRLTVLNRQLFASDEFSFDDVCVHVFTPPRGMYQVDHSVVHDGKYWHLFYCTGELRHTEEWVKRFQKGDVEGANQVCLEPGNGHAVGKDIFSLQFKENVFFPPQGRFDLASRGAAFVFRFNDRWGMLYDVRGENHFYGMSLAWSWDLETWELDPGNPYLKPPAWTKAGSTCKDPHVMLYNGTYLIYYIVMDRDGYCSVALTTTTDWKTFTDEGSVFHAAPMLRGTLGLESPCVVYRDRLWHLFITYGPGLWHAVGPGPRHFVLGRQEPWRLLTGSYCMGPFHATEIIEDPNGEWWLTTDRKEQTRRLNRRAGRLCYRGTYEDEKTLEEGLYLSRIRWRGDQPILEKPV